MEVWKAARDLAGRIHALSATALISRDYAFRNQILRASVSIVSNIAEGFEGQSDAVFHRYLASARGSAAEVRTQLYLALDWGYLQKGEAAALIALTESISRQLTGFMNYLKKNSGRP